MKPPAVSVAYVRDYMKTTPRVARKQGAYTEVRNGPGRSVFAPIPNHRDYALYLESRYVMLLLSASKRGDAWHVTREAAHQLFPLGLVEARGTALTVFGMTVRRALKAMSA